MKQQNVATVLVALVVLFVTFATAANPSQCDGFRITSPTQPGLQWTADQCYGVSFDQGASKVSTVDSVDLFQVSGTKKVGRLWSGPVSATAITTGNFRLDTRKQTGDYFFRVWTTTTDGKRCSFDTVSVHVTYNPNSPPGAC